MSQISKNLLCRLFKSESGQIVPWFALMMVLFLGMAGLTIDLGRAYVCYRELQASTDSAALAGAYAMTLSNATVNSSTIKACSYSSNTTGTANCPAGTNATPNLKTVATTATLSCVSKSGYVVTACNASPTGDNVIQVVQTATIPTYFIRGLAAFGIKAAKTLTLNAMSTATLVGSTPPVNVAMVIDTTASMSSQDNDPKCGDTRIHCALGGVQSMLTQLTPCADTNAAGTCIAYNQVSLFTFPPVEANTAQDDFTCGKGNPTITPYSTPAQPASGQTTWTAPTGTNATYQITSYLYNYTTTSGGKTTTNTSSDLNIATGASGVRNCDGMQTPGGDGTYYAGAINAAQASLMAAQTNNPGSQNIMIILSDGDANAISSKITGSNKLSGDVYGAANDECNQAISAAQNATSLGTTVYTVAYGAASSGCSTDTGSLSMSPCSSMQQMSSGWTSGTTSHFFSDSGASQNKGQCASNGATDLPSIFSAITAQFSRSRLIPNGSA